MRKLSAVALLAGTGAAVVVTAQTRIFTNPRPDDHLKKLFPAATAFSPHGGAPLHYKAYAGGPQAAQIGVAFWTTDLVPREHGYHGPIHILVGLDMSGTLTGVVVDYDSEPYGYFSVQPPEFAAQFAGKKLTDAFRVGGDVDAVSRATISISSATRAIRDGARLVAGQLLHVRTQ